MLGCFVHVFFVQVTILNIVWRSRHADVFQCAHFSTDICSVIQEGVKSIEKCAHRGTSARQERQMLSLGQNKHGQNITTPVLASGQDSLQYEDGLEEHTYLLVGLELHPG